MKIAKFNDQVFVITGIDEKHTYTNDPIWKKEVEETNI